MNIPLFNSSKFFDKSTNNFMGLNNNSILDKITNQNNFNNQIKLFNQIQPKIDLNINIFVDKYIKNPLIKKEIYGLKDVSKII